MKNYRKKNERKDRNKEKKNGFIFGKNTHRRHKYMRSTVDTKEL